MSLQISRSDSLSTLPYRKIIRSLEQTIKDCNICSETKPTLDNVCQKCRAINTAKQRYAKSNIPIRYWDLDMTRDFYGDKILSEKYNSLTINIHDTYNQGYCLCFAGGHGVGKQIALDTEIPTPNGFIKLIDLKEGDQLFDENGNVCNVIKLHPIDLLPESYRVEFDDGSVVEACADHLWSTWTRKERELFRKKNISSPKIRTTKDIYSSVRVEKTNIANHSIPCCQPINYPKKNLLIDPYVLGCWLGDGTKHEGTIECADEGILEEIKKIGYSVFVRKSTERDASKSCSYRIGDFITVKNNNGRYKTKKISRLRFELENLKLLNNKHIPEEYLYSSYKQRLSLLQGLMDTDGSCDKRGLSEFCTVNKKLAEQVHHLINSLGIKCNVKKNKSFLNGKRMQDRYRCTFTTSIPVYRLTRKLTRIRKIKSQKNRTAHRYIVNVIPVDPKPMRCITVDSSSNLFLITRSFIPTHNTMLLTNILKRACEKGYSCLYTTLNDIVEMVVGTQNHDKIVARKELLMIDFLVIEEFDPRHMGTVNASDLFGRTLENVFRTRAQNTLPLFMSTNSPNVIESFAGPIKDSIESLMNYVEIVPVLGKDFRKEYKA